MLTGKRAVETPCCNASFILRCRQHLLLPKSPRHTLEVSCSEYISPRSFLSPGHVPSSGFCILCFIAALPNIHMNPLYLLSIGVSRQLLKCITYTYFLKLIMLLLTQPIFTIEPWGPSFVCSVLNVLNRWKFIESIKHENALIWISFIIRMCFFVVTALLQYLTPEQFV